MAKVSRKIYASPCVAVTQHRWSSEAGDTGEKHGPPGTRFRRLDSKSQTPGPRKGRERGTSRNKSPPAPASDSLFTPLPDVLPHTCTWRQMCARFEEDT